MNNIKDEELEQLVKAISWKLYLEPDSNELKQKWQDFQLSANYELQINKIFEAIAEIVKQVLQFRVNMITDGKILPIELLWRSSFQWILTPSNQIDPIYIEQWHKIITTDLKKVIEDEIRKVLSENTPESPTIKNENTPKIGPTGTQIIKSTQPQQTEGNEEINTPNPDPQNDPDELPSPPVAQWKYLPIESQLDPHTEYDCKSQPIPEKLRLIGARVRGKMHKHNATNCDDWYEFDLSGNWTIIAVSDGAGSKKFSRIGAKISCQTAVKYLAEKLELHKLKNRGNKEQLNADFKQNDDWSFKGEDINKVQNALHEAMKKAYDAVQKEANERQQWLSYYKALDNRDLDIKDLSSTLLLAVHTTIKTGENTYNLVMTCQIGDGILAAISQENRLVLLGKPDSGKHAGETEFLTSKNKTERSNLIHKTFVFPGSLKALMVMTDGVADDYFPNDPGMLELYGDLLLNQVITITIPKPPLEKIEQELQNTDVKSLNIVRNPNQNFREKIQRIIPPNSEEPKEVLICSIKKYAETLGKSILDVISSPELLTAGMTEEGLCSGFLRMKPEEKLQLWLDSYTRRGSFDDRTLVVLYKEEI